MLQMTGSVLITGAGSGIGRATALELARVGMFVVATGRRAEPLEAVAAEIGALGGTVATYPLDVRDAAAVVRVVDEVTRASGPIDVLVANAGIHDASNVLDGDPNWWRQVVETNVLGVMNACHAVLPGMYERKTGHVVILSSTAGRVTNAGEPVYLATKHAISAFGDALRQSMAPRGIRMTLVEPGVVNTAMAMNRFATELTKAFSPLAPEDVARVIRFAIEQPPNCSVNEVVVRPTGQVL
jgi:NADP-dependent 3-hydroxy acid dehydrogenase YdfG